MTATATVALTDRIRSAYNLLADRPGQWVSLVDIRLWLQDVPRADLDAALRELACTGQASLAPESNQKALTPEQRAAAVRLGGQDKHLIWVG